MLERESVIWFYDDEREKCPYSEWSEDEYFCLCFHCKHYEDFEGNICPLGGEVCEQCLKWSFVKECPAFVCK